MNPWVSLARMCLLIYLILAHQGHFTLEQPATSLMFRHPRFRQLLEVIRDSWMICSSPRVDRLNNKNLIQIDIAFYIFYCNMGICLLYQKGRLIFRHTSAFFHSRYSPDNFPVHSQKSIWGMACLFLDATLGIQISKADGYFFQYEEDLAFQNRPAQNVEAQTAQCKGIVGETLPGLLWKTTLCREKT